MKEQNKKQTVHESVDKNHLSVIETKCFYLLLHLHLAQISKITNNVLFSFAEDI